MEKYKEYTNFMIVCKSDVAHLYFDDLQCAQKKIVKCL